MKQLSLNTGASRQVRCVRFLGGVERPDVRVRGSYGPPLRDELLAVSRSHDAAKTGFISFAFAVLKVSFFVGFTKIGYSIVRSVAIYVVNKLRELSVHEEPSKTVCIVLSIIYTYFNVAVSFNTGNVSRVSRVPRRHFRKIITGNGPPFKPREYSRKRIIYNPFFEARL